MESRDRVCNFGLMMLRPFVSIVGTLMSKNYIVTCIQFMLVAVRALLGYPKGRRNVVFIGGEIITKVLQGWWNQKVAQGDMDRK